MPRRASGRPEERGGFRIWFSGGWAGSLQAEGSWQDALGKRTTFAKGKGCGILSQR